MEVKKRIVDKRNKEKFFVDDLFLDKFSKVLDPTCLLTYMWLCRYSNQDGMSFPGQETLAEKIGVSVRTVQRNIESLRDHKLIEIQRMGKTRTNRYFLLDKAHWLDHPQHDTHVVSQDEVIRHPCQVTDTTPMSGHNESDTTPVSRQHDTHVVSHTTPMSHHSKEFQLRVPEEGVNDTNVSLQPEAAEPNIINSIFTLFREVNPTLNYANKTERSAAERLIKEIGETKALSSTRFAVLAAKSGDEFAPSITSPLELEKKMGKLIRFFNKKQLEQSKPQALYSVTI